MSGKKKIGRNTLFSLRNWLAVPEAARHLSSLFNEEINEADVLRLALDGHLILSVNFVNTAWARPGKVVSKEGIIWTEYSPDSIVAELFKFASEYCGKDHEERKDEDCRFMRSIALSDDRYLNLDNNIISIEGVWDLCMVGGERLDIEHQYQTLTGGPEITLTNIDGAFVEREDGNVCVLQQSFDENEFQEGSIAQLEQLKDCIKRNNIEKEKAKELLDQHKRDREKYLKARREKDFLEDYHSVDSLPEDSVLVVRTQALIDLQESLIRENPKKKKTLDNRSETTYLNIIGALLEIITGTFKDESFSSETQLREFIAEKFDDLRGVAPRTLADKFALAKKALNGEMD